MALGIVGHQIDWGVCRRIEACVGWLPKLSNLGREVLTR